MGLDPIKIIPSAIKSYASISIVTVICLGYKSTMQSHKQLDIRMHSSTDYFYSFAPTKCQMFIPKISIISFSKISVYLRALGVGHTNQHCMPTTSVKRNQLFRESHALSSLSSPSLIFSLIIINYSASSYCMSHNPAFLSFQKWKQTPLSCGFLMRPGGHDPLFHC